MYLRQQRINTDEIASEVNMSWKEVVQEWLEAQLKTFYSNVIRNLVDLFVFFIQTRVFI